MVSKIQPGEFCFVILGEISYALSSSGIGLKFMPDMVMHIKYCPHLADNNTNYVEPLNIPNSNKMTITQSPSAPLFVVVAATGNQGGSTIRALIASSTAYRIRALTRDSNSVAAKSLKELGCQVVQMDMSSSADLDSAFEGANFVYCMTLSEYASDDALAEVNPIRASRIKSSETLGILQRQTSDGRRKKSWCQCRCLPRYH